jgi:hypothetical protein
MFIPVISRDLSLTRSDTKLQYSRIINTLLKTGWIENLAGRRPARIPILFPVLFILITGGPEVLALTTSQPVVQPVIRIAVFRMAPFSNNFAANHKTIKQAVNQAAANGAD